MKSIMHDKREGACYLCMLLNGDYAKKDVQEHHAIFGTARRKLAEKYGLKVYLCLWHHTQGPQAVHNNRELADILKQEAQKAFQKRYPNMDFLEVFGRNYCDEAGGEKEPEAAGFRFLDNE